MEYLIQRKSRKKKNKETKDGTVRKQWQDSWLKPNYLSNIIKYKLAKHSN